MSVAGHFYVDVLPSETAPRFEIAEGGIADAEWLSNVIYPNDEQHARFPRTNRAVRNARNPSLRFTYDEVVGLKEGKMYMVVYGILTYRDIFDTPHWTKYCGFYTAEPYIVPTQSTQLKCMAFNGTEEQKRHKPN